MPTPEALVKAEVTDYLKKSGLLWFRMQSGVIGKGKRYIHLCEEGTADLLIFKNGRTIWCELKHSTSQTQKKRAESQKAFGAKVISEGHEWRIVSSLEEFLAYLG